MDMYFGAVVIDTNDMDTLADFYARLLGWEKTRYNDEWTIVRQGQHTTGIVIQQEDAYTPPTWPAEAGQQQQMEHLDFYVSDVDEAVQHALACGAAMNPVQLEDGWKVLLDPAGHTFCLLPLHAPE